MSYQRIEFSRPPWGTRIAVTIGIALALGLAAALVVLSIGIAIVFLPVIAVVLAIGWWRWRKVEARLREQAARGGPTPAGPVIEIDYEVIDDGSDRRG